jgi:hypothetical protein
MINKHQRTKKKDTYKKNREEKKWESIYQEA